MRIKYSALYLLLIMVSTSAFSCQEEPFEDIEGIARIESIYTDESVEAVLGGKIAGSGCDIYNLGLDYLDVDKKIAGSLFCNAAWKGNLDGAYNCAISLINGSDRTLGLKIISSLKGRGYKRAGFYLLKKKIQKDGYSSDSLVELERYKNEIPQAKFIYDYIKCKLDSSMELSECMDRKQN